MEVIKNIKLLLVFILVLSLYPTTYIYANSETIKILNDIYSVELEYISLDELTNNLKDMKDMKEERESIDNINNDIVKRDNATKNLLIKQKESMDLLQEEYNILYKQYLDYYEISDIANGLLARDRLLSFIEVNGDIGSYEHISQDTLDTSNYLSPSEIQDKITSLEGKIDTLEVKSDLGLLPKDYPVKGQFTSAYGYRIHPISGVNSFHTGVDIAVPTGTSLYAWFSGTVTSATQSGGNGKYITITNGDVKVSYLHLDEIGVEVGTVIKQGDYIGKTGNTGNSTGPHLHLSLYIFDVPVDPSLLIERRN